MMSEAKATGKGVTGSAFRENGGYARLTQNIARQSSGLGEEYDGLLPNEVLDLSRHPNAQ